MVSKTRKVAVGSAVLLACCFGSATVGVSASTAGSAAEYEMEDGRSGMSDMFREAIDILNPSAKEREALERAVAAGQIRAADYEDAHRRYMQCMTSRGFEPSFRKSVDGFYVELPYLSVTDEAALDAAVVECSADTAVLEALYRIQQANPNLVTDPRLLAVQCLEREGAVGADYTVEEFERNWSAREFPFKADQAAFNDCLYGAGFAYFLSE